VTTTDTDEREKDCYRRGEFSGRILYSGTRIVKGGKVKINGRFYFGPFLRDREGKRVSLLVHDVYASEYLVGDLNGLHDHKIEEPRRW